MKATGIIRRIDDLGRIVIPREIRRRMGIVDGDPLEIFYSEDENAICFSKYYPNSAQAEIDKIKLIAQDDLDYNEAKKVSCLLEQIETIFNS